MGSRVEGCSRSLGTGSMRPGRSLARSSSNPDSWKQYWERLEDFPPDSPTAHGDAHTDNVVASVGLADLDSAGWWLHAALRSALVACAMRSAISWRQAAHSQVYDRGSCVAGRLSSGTSVTGAAFSRSGSRMVARSARCCSSIVNARRPGWCSGQRQPVSALFGHVGIMRPSMNDETRVQRVSKRRVIQFWWARWTSGAPLQHDQDESHHIGRSDGTF